MKQNFELAGVWSIVNGEETVPSPGSADHQYQIWELKDGYAKVSIMHNVHPKLLRRLADNKSAHEMWTHLRDQYQQTGPQSIVSLFRKLHQWADAGTDIGSHILEFETTLLYLADAGIVLPEHIQAAILLSTLPNKNVCSDSWPDFVSKLLITENTKLSTTITAIQEKVRTQKTKDCDKKGQKAKSKPKKKKPSQEQLKNETMLGSQLEKDNQSLVHMQTNQTEAPNIDGPG